jgi:hypothetical protein
MTFFLKRKEVLRNKPTRIVFVLVAAAAVLSVGYITALAVLAPEQLAEATAAASDVICDKCVGTTDIADSAVTGAKIGSGQVKNSDIAGNAVTSAKIADGQVFSSDIAAVTIGATDLADSAVTTSKLAGGAVKPNVQIVEGSPVGISPGGFSGDTVDCPAGTILSGGGFHLGSNEVIIQLSRPIDENTWVANAYNGARTASNSIQVYALCEGAFP